jgi:hypothetical protein
MPQVSEIYSNLKRVTTTYDEEMDLPQAIVDEYNSRPVLDKQPTEETEEAIYIQYERNYLAAADRRWKEQKHFMGEDNERMRLVRILHPHEIFRRLQQAGVDARIEAPSFHVWQIDDKTGKPVQIKRERSIGRLWLADVAVRGRVGVSAWVTDKHGIRKREQVTTLQYPYGPEWSLLHFDEFDVPVTERYRGWRTAMMALILADVLTEDEVNRAFGPVPLSPVSLLYREKLQHHRKFRMGLIEKKEKNDERVA